MNQAKENMREAINGVLAVVEGDRWAAPENGAKRQ